MSPSEDSARPISVAELLARNGTIGAPPAGGRRRRRRGNSQAVTVAELTGEIPVIRPEEIPVAEQETVDAVAEEVADEAVDAVAEEVADEAVDAVVEEVADEAVDAVVEEVADEAVDEVVDEAVDEVVAVEESIDYSDAVDFTGTEVVVVEPEPDEVPEPPAPEIPPLSSPPWTRRKKGPELSHDPRPTRRPSGAEQMTYDPVDQSVNLADLVDNQTDDADELRSYLRSSGGTLFSGETVADDLARRGVADADEGSGQAAAPTVSRPREDRLTAFRHAAIAVLQSVLAVIFGAGLFIAFDQLWRWNNIVALVLSVLVILALVIAVRVVRKTEDIASTLIAVAVGALVTLGPLALLQST
jgi:hypothetical protein